MTVDADLRLKTEYLSYTYKYLLSIFYNKFEIIRLSSVIN